MHSCRKLCLTLFLSAAWGVFLSGTPAVAQTPSTPAPQADTPTDTDGGWHVAATPYIWFAGVHGTVGVRGLDTSVHASFGDVFSNLNIGIMGAVEARYNRIIIPVDFLWIKLSDDKGLPFQMGPTSIKAKLNESILTPKIGYRFVDEKRFKVDGLVGLRYWHLGTTLTLEPNQPLGGFYASADWVNPIVGSKIQTMLTDKLVLTVLGDVSVGSAQQSYQVAGLLGYHLKERIILQAGYRYLLEDYRPKSTFVYDAATSGLVLGATINLN
jgi:hypothetical protein